MFKFMVNYYICSRTGLLNRFVKVPRNVKSYLRIEHLGNTKLNNPKLVGYILKVQRYQFMGSI